MNDPIGPGTPAWESSDEAIRLYVAGNRRAGGMAMTRMIGLLKRQGVSQAVIVEWKDFVRNARKGEVNEYGEWI